MTGLLRLTAAHVFVASDQGRDVEGLGDQLAHRVRAWVGTVRDLSVVLALWRPQRQGTAICPVCRADVDVGEALGDRDRGLYLLPGEGSRARSSGDVLALLEEAPALGELVFACCAGCAPRSAAEEDDLVAAVRSVVAAARVAPSLN